MKKHLIFLPFLLISLASCNVVEDAGSSLIDKGDTKDTPAPTSIAGDVYKLSELDVHVKKGTFATSTISYGTMRFYKNGKYTMTLGSGSTAINSTGDYTYAVSKKDKRIGIATATKDTKHGDGTFTFANGNGVTGDYVADFKSGANYLKGSFQLEE